MHIEQEYDIERRWIRYYPAPLAEGSAVVGLGRREYIGIPFLYMMSAGSDLSKAREIALGISRQGRQKVVVGPDIDGDESEVQKRAIIIDGQHGLWGQMIMSQIQALEFQTFLKFGGLNG